MQDHSTLRASIGLAGAASIVLALAVVDDVGAHAPKPEARVTVFADHYVLAGRSIDDLDALEHAVGAANARSVRLDACGTGTDRAQMAAAHRFRHLYLELRLRDRDSPECSAAMSPTSRSVGYRPGPRPFGIDDETVDRWRHHAMP